MISVALSFSISAPFFPIMIPGLAVTIFTLNFLTVLFSDIQGFTKIAEEMNPEVLIDELDKLIIEFNKKVETYR